MYTIEDCPHFMCQDCKYFKINADREESLCKRIDHKKVKFYKSPFSSYHCGEHHIICHDFEPKHPEYADFQNWNGIDDYLNTFIESWHNGKVPLNVTLSFVTEAEELIFTAGAFLSTTIVPALICLLFPTPALSVAIA